MSVDDKKDEEKDLEKNHVEISENPRISNEDTSPSLSEQSNSPNNKSFASSETVSDFSPKKLPSIGMIVALVVAVGVAAFFAGSYFSNSDSDTVTKSEFNNAISRLEAKLDSAQIQPTTPPTQPVRISMDNDPIRGDPNAPITIIEFSDFQCPFCARFHVQTLPSLLEEYIETGKVNFVYRDFPIQSIHPNALPAAVAAECANEQGKYWEYHDTLFERQNSWARLDSNTAIETFSQYAQGIELEMEQFNSCLASGKYLEEVQNDLRDGRDYDVTGTPGFFIGNEDIGFVKLDGAQPFESFKRIIDAQLEA